MFIGCRQHLAFHVDMVHLWSWCLVIPVKAEASWRRLAYCESSPKQPLTSLRRPEYCKSSLKQLLTSWRRPKYCESPPKNCVDWYEDPKCASVFTDLIGIPVPLPCARAFLPAYHHFMAKVTLTLFFGRSPHNIRRLYITFCISSWDGTTALLHMRSQLGTQCIDEHRNGANPSRDVISYKNESLQGEMHFWGLWGDFARWLCELA